MGLGNSAPLLVNGCSVTLRSTFVMIVHNDDSGKITLRGLREKLGMSQREFAKEIGTTGATISRFEAGLHSTIKFTIPQICNLQKLLERAGYTFDDLREDL